MIISSFMVILGQIPDVDAFGAAIGVYRAAKTFRKKNKAIQE